MTIQAFPLALQPIIQTGILVREFEQALRSRLGYRMGASRENFAIGVGETQTRTRAGLKRAVTTPMAAALNTNLDNGLTPTGWGVEQYTMAINMLADTIDLNMVTSRVGIANQFVQNAKVNGEQAARSLDNVARNALFAAYLGGNTRVRTTLPGASAQLAVDDVRGFMFAAYTGVASVPVSSTMPIAVSINGNLYSLTGAGADVSNVSTAPGGMSGVLTFATNVSVADGTAGNSVLAATGSAILRPNGRGNTSQLVATDTLTMDPIFSAISTLEQNAIPMIDGAYNVSLDPIGARQIMSDPQFQRLFIGLQNAKDTFAAGQPIVSDFMSIRFLKTTEAPVQPATWLSGTNPNAVVRRPIVWGEGALIEGDFEGMLASDIAPHNAIVDQVDGICMVTREPLDRLGQIVAQSWYWIGGFCAPTDTTTNPLTVGTATNAAYKRAVLIEHVG